MHMHINGRVITCCAARDRVAKHQRYISVTSAFNAKIDFRVAAFCATYTSCLRLRSNVVCRQKAPVWFKLEILNRAT